MIKALENQWHFTFGRIISREIFVQENKISGKLMPWMIMSMEKCLPGGKYGRIEYVPGGKNSGDKCGAALKI